MIVLIVIAKWHWVSTEHRVSLGFSLRSLKGIHKVKHGGQDLFIYFS